MDVAYAVDFAFTNAPHQVQTPIPVRPDLIVRDIQARPQLILYGQILPGLRVLTPLVLTLERDGNDYIVSDDLFGVYGEGQTSGEARDDYIASLLDFYQLLAARVDINPLNRAAFEKLQTYVTTK